MKRTIPFIMALLVWGTDIASAIGDFEIKPLTLTTASSLEDQVTFWLDASTGTIAAFSVNVPPLAMTTAL